ncbi:MAG: 50S ribosomal protein L23 [Nanoarchaeota archaeon]
MNFKPVTTEKAVKLIDLENTLLFEFPRGARKEEIKPIVEKMFHVKVQAIRTLTRNNRKFVYIRLASSHKAADVATKLGLI